MANADWIKIMTNIFEDRKILSIRALPEGRSLVLIWLHLLVEAGKTNDGGWIYLKADRGYTIHEFAKNFDESAQIIEVAIRVFESYEMIEIDKYNRVYIVNWFKHQSVEALEDIKEKSREQKAQYRRANALAQMLIDDGHSRKEVEQMMKTGGKYDYKKIEALQGHLALIHNVRGHVRDVSGNVRTTDIDLELEKDSLNTLAQRPAKSAQIGARSVEDFQRFWTLYPNKKGKDRALKKWQGYYRAGKIDIDAVIAGTEAYIRYIDWQRYTRKDFSENFVKHGDTFVNNKGWEDDWTIPTTNTRRNNFVTSDDPDPLGIREQIRKENDRYRNNDD